MIGLGFGVWAGSAEGHPVNIAHRGGTVDAPENTLVNFQIGIDKGADWIEMDVWESSDGVLVIHHDATLDRTTDGTGYIYEHTFDELRALDAGSWFSPEFAGEQIPTLAEALTLVTPQAIAYLDIKRREYVPNVAALITSLGISESRVYAWIRYGVGMAADYKAYLPGSKRVFGLDHWYESDEQLVWQRSLAGDYGIAVNYVTLDAQFVDVAHSYGLTVHTFKVLSPYYQQILALGVDGLVVAAPGLLEPLLPGPQPECSDGVDNDGDGLTDFPAEPGCFGPEGPVELTACSNGADDDGDGYADYPADPGCYSTFSHNESPECDDGLDNDQSGESDFPMDRGCFARFDSRESVTCRDGLDNDDDGTIDFPEDDGCKGVMDPSEKTDCSDRVDNDGDGLIDYPADPDCLDAESLFEFTECDDGIDNDGDGAIDLDDRHCAYLIYASESPGCSDGLDNDADGLVDYPGDPGCYSPSALSENPPCSDGIDNDGDGEIDYPGDDGCGHPAGQSENPACMDNDDNDGDGFVDWPSDLGCSISWDLSEVADCSDGIDNNGDGLVDWPEDPQCSAPADVSEGGVAPGIPAIGGYGVVALAIAMCFGSAVAARNRSSRTRWLKR